jgi:hypothetical protein
MRLSLLAVMSLLVATPAWARASEGGQTDAGAIASALESPAAQDALTRTVDRLAGIVLDTRLGALSALADAEDDVRPDDTLRDVKERQEPGFERRLHRSTRRAVEAAGTAAGAAATQVAEIRRTAERLDEALGAMLGGIQED